MPTDVVNIDPGTNPSVPVAVEQIGGAEYQKVKQIDPTPESEAPIGVAANPWAVAAASLPLPAGASTEVTLASLKGVADSLLTAAAAIKVAAEALNTKTTAVNTGAIAGTVALDSTTLTALEHVSVDNFPAQTGATDAQMRATPLPMQQTTALQAAAGIYATNTPNQEQRVMDEPHQLMVDGFDTALDTVNRWNVPTTSGGATLAVVNGALTGTLSTTTGYAYTTSLASFADVTPGQLRFAFNFQFEAAPVAGAYRFWGAGMVQAAPSTAGFPNNTNTLVDAIGFELNADQKLYAVVYKAGVRTQIADLTAVIPTDGLTHNYSVFYRPVKSHWFIDTQEVPVATGNFVQSALNKDTLPACYVFVQGGTTAATATSNTMSVSDTAKNNFTLSDGTYGFRKATVKPVAAAASATDTALASTLAGTGDFAGVALIEECIKGNLQLTVTAANPELRDPLGATIPSDAPPSPKLVASVVGQQFTIDTMGYQTLSLSMGTMAASVSGCNDMGGTFGALSCFPIVLGTPVSTAAANTNYIIPCFTRFIKLTVTTVGWAAYNLRQQPLPAPYLANTPMNLAQIGAAAVAAASAQLGVALINVNGAVHSSTNPVYASPVAVAGTNNQTIPAINVVTATTPAATVLKASAGRLTMLNVSNGSANAAYLHLYNATSVTLGTTASAMVIAVPPTAGANIPVALPDGGLYFSTGICYAFTGAIASTDNTALTAPALVANTAFI